MANSKPESTFVQKEPCPACGSKDNLARYSDGHAYCFTGTCDYFEAAGSETGEAVGIQILKPKRGLEMSGAVAAIRDRGISEEVCRKYGVTVEFAVDGSIAKHHYPYFNNNREIVGSKVRVVADKNFYRTGESSGIIMFGQQTCRGSGKLTVVEGEMDVLAVSEMFNGKFDVVSINNGAKGGAQDIKDNLEFIEGYDEVRFALDMDKDGNATWDAVKDILEPGKAHRVIMPMKDANAMLMAGKVRDFTSAWWDAKPYHPDGIVNGRDTWDAIIERRNTKSIPYPFEGLNEVTRGIRGAEVVLLTSGTGMGKSQFTRELEKYLLDATEDNIGILALEESTAVTAMGLMSLEANRRLHLEEDTPAEELKPYWDKTLGTGRVYLFDHFGSTSEDNIINRCRYLIKGCGCTKLFLDHLSIVVSDQEGGDERKIIDAIMTKLRTLAQETGATIFVVCHLKRPEGKNHEEGARVTLGHLRGSGAIAQLSDIVIAFERNQQSESEEERNTTTTRVLKNRFTGETGVACYLKYDKHTGRMTETTKPDEDFGEL
jgi:twinkle protein